MDKRETIIISIGGSLIVPNEIDINFLKSVKTIVEQQLEKNKRIVIVCGGGKIARKYQNAAKKITNNISDLDMDWIGINATRMNACLVKSIFANKAYTNIIKNPTKEIVARENIIVVAGWKPGFSTDYDAVLIAKNLGSKKIVNLSNIDYVYDKDPNKFKNAKKIEKMTWEEFRSLIPDEWEPGLNSPFDPIASKEAQKFKMEVDIINGKNIKEVEKCLNGEKFKGTVIK